MSGEGSARNFVKAKLQKMEKVCSQERASEAVSQKQWGVQGWASQRKGAWCFGPVIENQDGLKKGSPSRIWYAKFWEERRRGKTLEASVGAEKGQLRYRIGELA